MEESEPVCTCTLTVGQGHDWWYANIQMPCKGSIVISSIQKKKKKSNDYGFSQRKRKIFSTGRLFCLLVALDKICTQSWIKEKVNMYFVIYIYIMFPLVSSGTVFQTSDFLLVVFTGFAQYWVKGWRQNTDPAVHWYKIFFFLPGSEQ